MALLHICTTNSLRAGIDQTPFTCHVCEQDTMFNDWCGATCDTCGADMEASRGHQAKVIRQRAKISRREIANSAGLQPSTIKKYEWTYPSEKYWQWFKGHIKELYSDNA